MENIIAAIRERYPHTPELGIILGSGLGGLADQIQDPCFIDYRDLPGFAVSTAPSHKGRFVLGRLCEKTVVCMQGRVHYYEGHPMEQVILPVRVMKGLGIKNLIVTNAAGGVNTGFEIGDFMLIKDHINFMGTNPLIGSNQKELGPRFCDMSYAYTPELRQLAKDTAGERGIVLHEGVYLGCSGPSYETPAEIRAFRILGADAVGMSTVPEVIAASHCGLPVLAISLITNMAAGVLDVRLTEEEVIQIGEKRAHVLETLVKSIANKL